MARIPSNGFIPPSDPYSEPPVSAEKSEKAERRILIDKICKCIPVVASFNAMADIYQKHTYTQKYTHEDPDFKMDDYKYRIMTDKTWEQVALLVPVLGQIVLAISSIVEACSSDSIENESPEVIDDFRKTQLKSNYPKMIYDELTEENRTVTEEQYGFWLPRLEDGNSSARPAMENIAMQGYSPAQYALGMYYLEKTEDKELARFWLNEAVHNGVEHAADQLNFLNLAIPAVANDRLNYLMERLEGDDFREETREQCLEEVTAIAEAGDPEAQSSLGRYYLGKGNREIAEEWLVRGALTRQNLKNQ